MRVKLFNDIYLVFKVSVYDSHISMQISNAKSIKIDTNRKNAKTMKMLDSLYTSGFADLSDFENVHIINGI